jgi:hypothetical protein
MSEFYCVPLEQIGSAPHAYQLADTGEEKKVVCKGSRVAHNFNFQGGRYKRGEESLILRDHKKLSSLQK